MLVAALAQDRNGTAGIELLRLTLCVAATAWRLEQASASTTDPRMPGCRMGLETMVLVSIGGSEGDLKANRAAGIQR